MTEILDYNDNLHVPEKATVLHVQTLSPTEKLFRLALASGENLGHKPGQFLMLTIPNVGVAPISIASSPTDKGWFELGVRAITGGNVTPQLHAKKTGDTVFVSKPMGNGFPLEQLAGKDLFLVAGGIGLFPLRSLVRYVRVNISDFGRTAIFFGAKTPDERLLPEELEMWRKDPTIEFYETVDNGSSSWKGNVGLITTLFGSLDGVSKDTNAIVIGPDIMFKFVTMELIKLGLSREHIFASTERKMSCGLGFCRNCLLPNGKLACKDGPVFSATQLGL